MRKKIRQRRLPPSRTDAVGSQLRIIGGSHRGRRFRYHGDRATRPMKERVREAIFNLLGPRVRGKRVIDLFAGTGALALEALSRGAEAATLIERHFPTARLIRDNALALEFPQPVEVLEGDAFFYARERPFASERPWLVFCCPPYEFYVDRTADMLELIQRFVSAAPVESLLVVESDERFDVRQLPNWEGWDIRVYRPAQVALTSLPWTEPSANEEPTSSTNTET